MSEWDIVWWLQCRRIEGNEYYSVAEIHKGLSCLGRLNGSPYLGTTRNKTWNLFRKKFLDQQRPQHIRDWNMKFRLKKKYVDIKIKNSENNIRG